MNLAKPVLDGQAHAPPPAAPQPLPRSIDAAGGPIEIRAAADGANTGYLEVRASAFAALIRERDALRRLLLASGRVACRDPLACPALGLLALNPPALAPRPGGTRTRADAAAVTATKPERRET